ncbi:MAG: hypothetical protein HY077_19085 [Elusimicrobia bacterium]|nr:hypothetical protein [Elusimicrobiota bacterium]
MKPSWRGKRVLITSGPTREHLDPIRYLTNASSGRMGAALAAQAARLGAKVTMVSGPGAAPAPRGVRLVPVVSGVEMYRAALALSRGSDVVIGAAAVSDWRFESRAQHKIKRDLRPLRLTLIPNPDIIKEVSLKRRPGSSQIVVGFALETRRRLETARGKLESKGLDLIVANGPSSLSGGKSQAAIIGRGEVTALPALSKAELARRIMKAIEREWQDKN